MYTQCPGCKVAFRVTPKVLQQASGNVRCGSCGDAFNALDHLSDSAPRDTLPSAGNNLRRDAESASLDESLSQLGGPDEIEIEDTGVEWRVVGGSGSGSEAPLAAPDLPTDSGHAATIVDEPRFDDNTPLSEDFFDDVVDPPPYEPPRRRASDREPADFSRDNEDQVDLDLSEPEDWVDVLGEFSAPEDPAEISEEDMSAALEAIDPGDSEPGDELELDDDSGEADDDISEEDLSAALEALEADGDDVPDDDIELTDGEVDDSAVDDELSAAVDQLERALQGDISSVAASDSYGDLEPEAAAENESGEAPTDTEAADDEPGALDDEALDDEDDEDAEESGRNKKFEADILAMTANMEIDPEVILAMKDGDVGDGMVETVVMESGSVEDFIDDEGDTGTGLKITDEPASLLDTYMLNRKKGGDPGARGSGLLILSIFVLALVLAAQGVHSQREYLATTSFFGSTLGGFYESIGSPIVPNWDARQWQFESTSGSSGEDEQLLTITSRISNRSDKALPYPLIHVSLTDRYEEIVGSRVLEPRDYVPRGTNPNRPVRAGENFTAEITFSAASRDATGFKLNVCYPDVGGAVRCAIEDFK